MSEDFGFVRVAAAVPKIKLADCKYNSGQIKSLIDDALREQVEVVCFPELAVTGYTCGDLFFLQSLQKNAVVALQEICEYIREKPIVVIVGAPLKVDNNLYNCAFVMTDGEVVGVVPKINLPNTSEFYEKRWFTSGRNTSEKIDLWNGEVPFGSNLLFCTNRFTFGVELCEDLWSPLPPSTQLAIQGAELIFNLSSSNCLVGKNDFRRQMITQQSARVHCGYIYTSSGWGESTSDVVYSGSTYIAENGEMLLEGDRFQRQSHLEIQELDVECLRTDRQRNTNFTKDQLPKYQKIYATPIEAGMVIDPKHRKFRSTPFLPVKEEEENFCEDALLIQCTALAHRWEHTKAQTLLIGISGGLDSTLALLIAVQTADMLGYSRKQVMGITMPGFGTSDRTYRNALKLMDLLGVSQHEIPIREAVMQHFYDIEQNPDNHDITYENSQARERTQILMDLANKYNGLVVGTGDMSELALGWATYNGDHMSMYGVNAGIPKTLVRYLVRYQAQNRFGEDVCATLMDIIDTPVSPELLPADNEGQIAQKTEDKLGPYELHDFFMYYFLRYGFSREKIAYLASLAFEDEYETEMIEQCLNVFMKRFFTQQFKRSCLPDGPKVVQVSLSPRGDLRMPSDAYEIKN